MAWTPLGDLSKAIQIGRGVSVRGGGSSEGLRHSLGRRSTARAAQMLIPAAWDAPSRPRDHALGVRSVARLVPKNWAATRETTALHSLSGELS
jgi:hypothetical protein